MTFDLVKATAPAIAERGADITTAMYARLLTSPRLIKLFAGTRHMSRDHASSFAAAILSQAESLADPQASPPPVEQIVREHVSMGIKPAHYPFLAAALLPAIRDVLGPETITDEVLVAWAEVYWAMADILIEAEGRAYAAQSSNGAKL